jgi:hypothetical protein
MSIKLEYIPKLQYINSLRKQIGVMQKPAYFQKEIEMMVGIHSVALQNVLASCWFEKAVTFCKRKI